MKVDKVLSVGRSKKKRDGYAPTAQVLVAGRTVHLMRRNGAWVDIVDNTYELPEN